jgi:hypothetical protein
MRVIHIFEESSSRGQADHLDVWFGHIHAADELDDGECPVVCFCGARMEPLKVKDGDVVVGAVWHLASYPWGSR